MVTLQTVQVHTSVTRHFYSLTFGISGTLVLRSERRSARTSEN